MSAAIRRQEIVCLDAALKVQNLTSLLREALDASYDLDAELARMRAEASYDVTLRFRGVVEQKTAEAG